MPRVIVVMFDTLCRHFIPTYGNEWIKAPNFERLYEHSVQMENAYVGSMPCMPARREMHTGRYNFLHRSWGPLEPFDDSMPETLKRNGIHSHKVTDHQHYWEDGGATYHQRFKTFEFVRGQEGDKWIGEVSPPPPPPMLIPLDEPHRKQDWINRQHMVSKELQPQYITFSQGLEFIQRNHTADNWFLQIETFDPHEPFFSQKEFQEMYPHQYNGPLFDWPPYREVREDPSAVQHIRYLYAALLAYCDSQLGRFLDVMDELDLWDSTMVIVNTDHGLLMGEHDWWAKCVQPFFQEIAHIPMWIWDPRYPDQCGVKRKSLVQTMDLPATILEYFDLPIPKDMMGKPLRGVVENDHVVHGYGLYGIHGGQVNITDGTFVYMRGAQAPHNLPLYEYTLMPTRMRRRFKPQELREWDKFPPFEFTKNVSVMRVPARRTNPAEQRTELFNVVTDPMQRTPLHDLQTEIRMIKAMVRLMASNDSPLEQYERLGLPFPSQLHDEQRIRRSCVCVPPPPTL